MRAVNQSLRHLHKVLCIGCLISTINACSWIGEDGTTKEGTNDYRDAEDLQRMQVPDGMDSSRIVDLFPMPPLSPDADEAYIDEENLPLPTAITSQTNQLVLLQSLNGDYWVLVKSAASQVWPRLKSFIEQEKQLIVEERAAAGFIIASDSSQQNYHYRVSQGFQQKSAEVRLRVATANEISAWPLSSHDKQLELDLLERLSLELAQTVQQSSYSYAALGISEQKKLTTKKDAQGFKSLVITANLLRAKASLKRALVDASFDIVDVQGQTGVIARYVPQLAEEDQPGFFWRLFGVNPEPFDDNVEFAGNYYRFNVKAIDSQHQRIVVESVYLKAGVEEVEDASDLSADAKLADPDQGLASHKRELNTILLQVKRNIY